MKIDLNTFKKLSPVILSRGLGAVTQLVLLLIYAEFLSKGEFGELSLLMIFIGLSYAAIDFGIANTLISNNLSKKDRGRVRTLAVTLSILLSLVFMLISVNIGEYFGTSKEFSYSLDILAIFFVLHAISIVPYARLHKAQKIKELSWVDLGSVMIMFGSAVTFLNMDLGLYAFPMALLVQSLSKIGILSFFSSAWFNFRLDIHKINFLFIFDYCKKNFAKNIRLMHDYDLYEFTILVKKD